MTTLAPTMEQTGTGIRRWISLGLWNLNRSLMITRREVVDMFRDWRILVPIVVLTGIFPYIANWGAGRMLSYVNQYGANVIGERLVPFLLMIVGFFPTSFSLIIALESFVGEKERRSLEPLLSTPLTDLQLYIGKTLSSTIPPIVGSLIGITVYLVSIYFNPSVQWSPPISLLAQILSLTMLQALVMVAGAVVVSSQSTSVRAANLLASFIIIPMAFLIQLEAFIMFLAIYDLLWWICLGLVVVLVILVRMGVHTFNREELLGRELDELNLRAIISQWLQLTLARQTAGQPRRRPWLWIREEVLAVIWRLRREIGVLVIAVAAAYWLGIQQAGIYRLPPALLHSQEFGQRFEQTMAQIGLAGAPGISFVLWQNVRVLAVASLLAVFSFGVMVILIVMAPISIAGYLTTQLLAAGLNPMTVYATLIPHSLFEVPAAILAAAAALRLGAVVISPPPNRTLGQAWMEALADATRLWVTVVLPLLIIAAIVEVTVTPSLVGWVARGG
jgi:uncharacterized membrane protein SpoIIM required for sporulation/ABC-type transport system involved in multi-copper enzyme maturation permease subunit